MILEEQLRDWRSLGLNVPGTSVRRDQKSDRDRFRDIFSVPNFFRDGSGTFFGTKFYPRPVPRLFSVPNSLRDRFRDFFRYQIFFETDSETFFGTKFFRDRFRDFFRYQIFFETGSDTIQKIQKSRERDETDTETQTDTKIVR